MLRAPGAGRSAWGSGEQYLKPVLQDDALLCYDYDEEEAEACGWVGGWFGGMRDSACKPADAMK
jgi:hypothetical protein